MLSEPSRTPLNGLFEFLFYFGGRFEEKISLVPEESVQGLVGDGRLAHFNVAGWPVVVVRDAPLVLDTVTALKIYLLENLKFNFGGSHQNDVRALRRVEDARDGHDVSLELVESVGDHLVFKITVARGMTAVLCQYYPAFCVFTLVGFGRSLND